MAHRHDPEKQLEAFAELISRIAERANVPVTNEQSAKISHGLAAMFDIAGHASLRPLKKAILDGADDHAVLHALVPFRKWVHDMLAAGPYDDVGGGDTQAQNCAAEICC